MRSISKRTAFNLAQSTFFAAAIFVPFIMMWAPDNVTAEKRNLADFPQLALTEESFTSFPARFERYANDHFGLRESFLTLLSQVAQRVFRTSGSPKVILGKDGWLFYTAEDSLTDMQRLAKVTEADVSAWRGSVRDRAAWLESQGITYRFVVAPDKHTVYRDYLPNRYKWDGESRFSRLAEQIGRSDVIVDLSPDLVKRAKSGDDDLYFRTDTHWTSYGAFVGYREIMKSLGNSYRPVEFVDNDFLSDQQPEIRDLAQMARITAGERDQVSGRPFTECLAPDKVVTPVGLDVSSMSWMTASSCKGKHGTALVFHDSFMTVLKPYLSSTFKRVVYVWGQPNDEIFLRFVEQEKPDVVIEERVERTMRTPPPNQFTAALSRVKDKTARQGAHSMDE